jgi:hypothetical protein
MPLLHAGWLLVLSVMLPLSATRGQSQPPDSSVSPTAIEALAKAHVALTALRSQLQAEMAEPKAKKPAVQTELRARLQTETTRVLKEHGMTAAEFARLTRRVSTDDALRKVFDESVARVSSGGKSGA